MQLTTPPERGTFFRQEDLTADTFKRLMSHCKLMNEYQFLGKVIKGVPGTFLSKKWYIKG